MEIVIVFERGLGISFARVDRLNSIKAQKQDQAKVSGKKIKHNIYITLKMICINHVMRWQHSGKNRIS